MTNQLYILSLFELKKNLVYSKTWITNALFILVNISIFPFAMNSNSSEILDQFFLPVIMTSLLLGIVLITCHVFDDDASDETLSQFQIFGVRFYVIYLSKVIAASIEFILILGLILPLAGIFYSIPLVIIAKISLVIILSIPLLTSISIFGAMLTLNLQKNSTIAILLTFPLLISVLIILGIAANRIIETSNFIEGLSYLEINLGVTLLLLPPLCWLSKYLN